MLRDVDEVMDTRSRDDGDEGHCAAVAGGMAPTSAVLSAGAPSPTAAAAAASTSSASVPPAAAESTSASAHAPWVPWVKRPLEPTVRELILGWNRETFTLPPLPEIGGGPSPTNAPPWGPASSGSGGVQGSHQPQQGAQSSRAAENPLQPMLGRSIQFVEALQRKLRGGQVITVQDFAALWPNAR